MLNFNSKKHPFSIQEGDRLRRLQQKEREQLQGDLLQQHLRQANKAPYYRELFAQFHLSIDDIRLPQDLPHLPLTERQDLEGNTDNFRAVARTDIAEIALTSGSTSSPLEIP
jgi:phenylacetate-coenzyme A ligase PaaK-like adenylate-forming protein